MDRPAKIPQFPEPDESTGPTADDAPGSGEASRRAQGDVVEGEVGFASLRDPNHEGAADDEKD